jgi:hypothetical protein
VRVEIGEPSGVKRPVFVVSTELRLREQIAEIPAANWCHAGVDDPLRPPFGARSLGAPGPTSAAQQMWLRCDPSGPALPVGTIDNEVLQIAPISKPPMEIPLRSGGVFEREIAPPVAASGPCPARKLRAIVERVLPARSPPEADQPAMRLRIPELSFSMDWGLPDHLIRCSSQAYGLAHQQDVGCIFRQDLDRGELHLWEKDGVLFLSTSAQLFAAESHIEVRGAVVLPCGASVSPLDFFIPAPFTNSKESPECVCQDQHEVCERRCLFAMTDAAAKLTAEGTACVNDCQQATERCSRARCARRPAPELCGVCPRDPSFVPRTEKEP